MPEEGEIVENKLSEERYEVYKSDSYREVLKSAKRRIKIRRSSVNSIGRTSETLPLFFITSTSTEDSLKNPDAILVKGKLRSKYYSNIDKTAYIQGLLIITEEKFNKKYRVVD
ncbi:hypothetical protein [Halalkalibaculum sp. DA384]|uniref:hypothetical protein n=1 Tax=Halalkalibaculum sp. DA384 TaxID=3373606 RepID=UPI0037543926